MQIKTCSTCKKDLLLTEFHKVRSDSEQRKSKCKKCQSIYFQDYKRRNEESLRKKWVDASKRYYTLENRRIKNYKRYNLTIEDYDAMFSKQNGKCAICFENENLVIDHDHATGLVRGLLCQRCNKGLGMFKDSPERMKSAIIYIAETSLGG